MTASVTFLLGAGFSQPFGIPAMRAFLDSFRDMARTKYPDLHGTLEQHLDELGDDSDIEALLASLSKAERLKDAMPARAVVPEELRIWQEQSRYLKSHLISFIIERCERFDQDAVRRVLSPSLRMLLDRKGISNVHLFTTNYDRIVEFACEASGVEFSDGFGETGNELVAPWTRTFDKKVCIYKLHGSVSYYVDQTTSDFSQFLRLDRGYPLPGPDFRLSRGGKDLEPMMVLPTLEKDALGEPYSHLNHLFTETMAHTLLVVAVGISLRDNHIVSAINYNAGKVVVLLVDVEPMVPSQQISDIKHVKLRVDASTFFKTSIFRLMDTISDYTRGDKVGKFLDVVREFADREASELAVATTLTDLQQGALNRLLSSARDGELLEAIQDLRGVSEDGVLQAIAEKSDEGFPRDVRKAVAGCIGHSSNRSAIRWLERIAREDPSSDVRLESYLALSAIGSDVALEALEGAKTCWPNDSYFTK